MKKLIYSIFFVAVILAFGSSIDSQAATVSNCAITANTINISTGATSTIKLNTSCQSSVIKLKTNKNNSKDLITQDDWIKIISIIAKYGMPDYDSVSPEEIAYYMAKNKAAAASLVVEGGSSSTASYDAGNITKNESNWLVYLILIIAIAGVAWFFVMWKGDER